MNDAEERRQKGAGWILYDGDEPVGAGPGMHAALADGRRRTGWPETHRHRLVPATAEEMQAAASKLGPGGLTAAEAAWCAGTMNSVPSTGDRSTTRRECWPWPNGSAGAVRA